MSAMPWLRPLERSDRSVRRLRLRLPAGESQTRVSFALEEALRLTVLPGEDQGRAYFFRRVAFAGLPAAAPRSLWLNSCQKSLRAMAERAVHGRDARAADADAVYFATQQEALEWFLGRLLRAVTSVGVSSPVPLPWFAPMITGVPADRSCTAQFIAVIERLRRLPSGWFAAATAIYATLPPAANQVASILVTVTATQVNAWLQEFGWIDGGAISMVGLPPSLSLSKLEVLHRFLAMDRLASGTRLFEPSSRDRRITFQPEPWLVWLTALAIAAEQPTELNRGTMIAGARAILEGLQASAMPSPSGLGDGTRALSAHTEEAEVFSPPTDDRVSEAAGLYFLLNALRQLGIESVLSMAPSLVRYGFVPRLIVALAQIAAVDLADPALEWAQAELETSDFSIEPVVAASSWPRNLPPPPDGFCVDAAILVRIWKLAVRRWCWRTAGLTLREIVNRPGRILLARADLDVFLSLEFADVRIRRIGLDLDPGWLPWFGRVVRFHYLAASRNQLQQAKDGGKL